MLSNNMKIGSKMIGHGCTYFVIEEGQANLGEFNLALKMIDSASKIGADAIEFQIAHADDFYIKSHKAHNIYKEREFSEFELKELVKYTKEKNIELILVKIN